MDVSNHRLDGVLSVDDASISFLPLICLGVIVLVVTILASWGLFRQYRYWRRGPPGKFSTVKTTALAVVVGVVLMVPMTMFAWTLYIDEMEQSRPDLSYYTFTDEVECNTTWFEAELIMDFDSVMLRDRVYAFVVDDDGDTLYLRSVDLEGPGVMVETETLAEIGNSTPPLKARGTTTAAEEDGMLAVYYSYIVRSGTRTETWTWRMESEDGTTWSSPVRVGSEPDDAFKEREIPSRFERYRNVEVYEHRIYRTSTGGSLLVVRYYHDEGDYPDFKGTYFAHRPKGEEWSGLVSIGYLHQTPVDVHELSDGTFVVVTGVRPESYYYNVGTYRFGPNDFEDLTGPILVD